MPSRSLTYPLVVARVLALLSPVMAWAFVSQERTPAHDNRLQAPALPAPLPVHASSAARWVGAGSCAASNCHGSAAPIPGLSILGNEYPTWIDDPHARAYDTLHSPRSERIARNLSGGKDDQYKPAYLDNRCLACHSTPRPHHALESTAWMNPDGVGCESCHGAAREWLGPHTTSWWKTLDASSKLAQYGFRDTKTIATRAETCVGCHVGSRDRDLSARDVNHDLIAAGHPRLAYEFAAYHDRLPRHWVEKGDNTSPDFATRAWFAGQASTLASAIALTRDRAANPEAPWPEFAEYSCFGCHHSLADQGWRAPPRAVQAPAAAYHWGSWYLPAALDALRAPDRPIAPSLERFQALLGRPFPDRTLVVQEAKTLLSMLSDEQLAPAPTFNPAALRRSLETLAELAESASNWDIAAQHYLAAVPLWQTWSQLDPSSAHAQAAFRTRLDQLLARLTFPPGADSPDSAEFSPR